MTLPSGQLTIFSMVVSQVTVSYYQLDLDLGSLQATSPRFFGLKPEVDLTLEKPPRPASVVPSMLKPCLLGNFLSPANEINDLNDVPATLQAATNETPPALPQGQGLQRDEKFIV
ncbi:hypothetical protein DSO57_1029287 [Entomophthora muscae]|uniref:Uncharacterized protein n=1 Tax=Entomophthora muscae TaxID=34485 RepID=A0ACC2TC99_9FUNG|nr:hypothetical protein DSO57_1029287 [Entomophthora muscae]